MTVILSDLIELAALACFVLAALMPFAGHAFFALIVGGLALFYLSRVYAGKPLKLPKLKRPKFKLPTLKRGDS
jgi:hypothetical protein